MALYIIRKLFPTILVLLSYPVASLQAQNSGLTGDAANLYRAGLSSKFGSQVKSIKYKAIETSDRQSFSIIWKSKGENSNPSKWIVSLPGSHGYATDELAIWSKLLNQRDVGLIVIQYWLGEEDTGERYYPPFQIYRELDLLLKSLKIPPGSLMLHGFSRGSANLYALAAIDQTKGSRYFGLFLASSGGMNPSYPPNIAISRQEFGEHPLANTQWITSAGALDHHPDRDGIPAMQKTATWLKAQGAKVILQIEDPNFGHGALVLNPKNANSALDIFFKQ